MSMESKNPVTACNAMVLNHMYFSPNHSGLDNTIETNIRNIFQHDKEVYCSSVSMPGKHVISHAKI